MRLYIFSQNMPTNRRRNWRSDHRLTVTAMLNRAGRFVLLAALVSSTSWAQPAVPKSAGPRTLSGIVVDSLGGDAAPGDFPLNQFGTATPKDVTRRCHTTDDPATAALTDRYTAQYTEW